MKNTLVCIFVALCWALGSQAAPRLDVCRPLHFLFLQLSRDVPLAPMCYKFFGVLGSYILYAWCGFAFGGKVPRIFS